MTQMYRNLVVAVMAMAASFAVMAQTSGASMGGRDGASPSSGAVQDQTGSGRTNTDNASGSGAGMGTPSGTSGGTPSSTSPGTSTGGSSYDGMPPTSAGSHSGAASGPSDKGTQKSTTRHRKSKHHARHGDSDPVDPHGGLNDQSDSTRKAPTAPGSDMSR